MQSTSSYVSRYPEGSPEAELFSEINQGVDLDIDWKKGARRYASNLTPANVDFLYRKPFRIYGDISEYFRESYRFLNFLERINPEPGARVLDVACGPGWTCEYMSRLGHRVVGIDIASELLDIARKRLDACPFPPFGERLDVKLAVHDIEEQPFMDGGPFDIALIESALHHFIDPLAALRNIRSALSDEGVLCIMETVAPPRDSEHWKLDVEIMKKYHTLVRPFTREQFQKLLRLSGFEHFRFYSPINGWFDAQNPLDRLKIEEKWIESENLNFCLASPSPDFLQ